jgi:predicted GNAT family acetyltransferase
LDSELWSLVTTALQILMFLYGVLHAANYMDIDELINLGCTVMADGMRGKTLEQIRETFDIDRARSKGQEAECLGFSWDH